MSYNLVHWLPAVSMSKHGYRRQQVSWSAQAIAAALLARIVVYLSVANASSSIEWPLQRMANISGDVFIGVMVPIHERDDRLGQCGRLQGEDGIQLLEAVIYAVNEINDNTDLLPGFTLGMLALDTCSSESYALKEAIRLIRPYIVAINGSPGRLNAQNCSKQGQEAAKVVAVVGSTHSAVTIQEATLLGLFNIPQVSYLSTTPTLSNVERFPYFTRTVPSDVYQAYAIIKILREFNWTYVSAVYDDSNYGIKGFQELEKLSFEHDVCFGVTQRLQKEAVQDVVDDAYDYIITKLKSNPKANVVVAFVDMQQARRLMAAAHRVRANFTWIGSDGWSSRTSVVDGLESTVDGAITVQPLARTLPGFANYFTRLRPDNHSEKHNPWFKEYWESEFQCRYVGEPVTPFNSYSRTCTSNETFNNTIALYLHFIYDAVYAIAHALKDMHRVVCGVKRGMCAEMHDINVATLTKYLKNVTFKADDYDAVFNP
ncbi:PREDICTED: metabotropic glutamate receptor 3-like [Priapulus caudatus]|uniref:Metabotropic glutamate receptor 3-like n=1 Tax=Priapulus caudatus TaxID=37621 RepID=A0ABM1FBN4_PRICU|nr:PREDICTED: metabotropic glutamate receptor 3-like [Priapulus caudatus]